MWHISRCYCIINCCYCIIDRKILIVTIFFQNMDHIETNKKKTDLRFFYKN